MRRVIAVILCIFLLAATAYASNTVNSVSSSAVANTDGSCQVTVTASLYLDEPVTSLTVPLGSGISAVTLNGSGASLTQSGGVTSIRLDGLAGQTGSISFVIRFTVDNILSTDDEGNRIATIPLLPSFPYPVEHMDFTVTMPAEFESVPAFFSGYHGQDIERRMTTSITGNQISGSLNESLKDSETLYLKLAATDELFPQSQTIGGTLSFDTVAMGVCMGLALVYWLLTMGCLPSISRRRAVLPEGINAGLLGCYLVHKPADLTMMVINWAQLGYLIIHMNDHGRVILHKKMEMGNERSVFEQRCFKSLFGRGNQIDATGYRYTMAYEKTAQLSRRYASGYRPGSGNPLLFRLIASAAGIFAGLALGDSIATSPVWRIILMIVGAVTMTMASWIIQEGMQELHLLAKDDLKLSLILSAALPLLGALCGCFPYLLALVLWNLFTGLAAAYGGRRSENGQRIYTQILGLRRYMRKAPKSELMRILHANYGYYYELAPYALALGVDKQFAARFESLEQPMCTWLVTPVDTPRTATEWYPLLRQVVATMNRDQKRSLLEKLLNRK